ncbi:PREDICTED: uncharacterized protein LOC108769820 [Trachymyrmex cornetzi]|uniref:uncharacterized protein LOC108769820 n=1 Tax=Trachymyrmex cornetzi TaxID=471704 RepID=UPI00084F37EF|nr:PREDICTED: uncharacterized protein LOC108769820 [Trachymyrmex cornetzi]
MANDDEDVAVLKRRRGIILGSCTRIRTFADSAGPVTPSVAAQLEERRSKLESYWSEYDSVQTKIELRDESEANNRVTFEDAYFSLSARLREMLSITALPRAAASPSPSTSSATVTEHFNHIKLPKLDLPKFSGKYDEWFPFFDTFKSLIHANAALSDIQRLQYLRASLTGDAAKLIIALEISSANYEVAWNPLKERYDNKRAIVHSHVKAIMELPSMAKEKNIAKLRQIADGATRHLHALQALKRPTAHWDDLLIYILSNKLDTLTSREWQLSLTGSELPTLKQFIEFLAHRCQTLETSSKSPAVSSKGAGARAQSQSSARQQSCVAAVRTKCSFCKGSHLIYHCQNFLALPVPQRITEIRKRKACANCLRSTDHVSNKCPSGNCKLCKSKHNTLLHLAAAMPAKPDGSEVHDRATGELSPASSPAALVTNNTTAPARDCIMLSTAVVWACDSWGSRKSCRVLLDAGSQANFVSRRLIEASALRRVLLTLPSRG